MINTNNFYLQPAAPLFALTDAVYPVSEGAKAYVTERVQLVQISKGTLLVSAGQHCDHLYFVNKGVLRGYVKQDNKDITTWITAENELVTSISSYYQQIPSIENIEALEDCILASIHRDDMHYLYQHFPEVNALVRIILEKYYQDAEERAYICRLTDATAKYHRFINTKSHLLNRIPLKFIASYLGMTLETLSRIRSRLSHQRF
jgi:CRP-like cAMP-binding protein